MAEEPVEGQVVDPKDAPLSLEQRMDRAEGNISEIARGVNLQGALLETIVVAFDAVIKKYLTLTKKPKDEKKD